MSLSKTDSVFNTRNIAIAAGVGIVAAGLLYWALDDPEHRLNEKLAIKIYREIIKETFLPSWVVANTVQAVIVTLRAQGKIKSKAV